MESPIHQGYLVIADISGYTSFLAESELDHAPDILRSILTLLIGQLTPTLELAEVEGDAIFAYAPATKISRGELLLELIEATYVAFRDHRQTMQHNATCPCKACRAIPTLGLKFVTHYGDFVLQDVSGKTKPVGSCVNLVHRLLKNSVSEATGWSGYALFSEESLDHMGVCPEPAHKGVEVYEHLSAVKTRSINLDARYKALMDDRRLFLSPDESDIALTHDFSAPIPMVWDWLNDPAKRTSWIQGSSWSARARPLGRTGPAAQNHCAALNVIEHVSDWRPFKYYTVCYKRGFFDIMTTGTLEPVENGTHIHLNIKLDGPLPRWVLRPMIMFVARRMKMQMKKYLQTLEQCIADAAQREYAD
jgi:hypothetical protein